MRKRSAEQKQETKNAIIKNLKALIAPGIFALIIGGLIFFVVNYQNKEEEEQIIPVHAYAGDGREMVLENSDLKFTFDPNTTYFTLLVKSSGKVWTAVPDDVDDDAIAMSSEKGRIRCTLNVIYANEIGSEVSYNNYDYSIKNQTYDVETDGESITVHYSIGKVQKEFVIPPVCTVERMEGYFANLSQGDLNMVKQYYKKYDLNDLGRKDDPEALLEAYPALADGPLYVLRDTATDSIKGKLQTIFEESAGYTYEEFLEDKELVSSEEQGSNAVYNIDVTYRLDGGDLIVEVPYSTMEYPKERPILAVDVLPFFGAGGMDDEGFLLVPEGSGALINFNNGKTAQSVYYANVYGWDMAHARDALVHSTSTVFSTFGISNGNDSFICNVEGGSAYAAIEADISGRFNSYNNVNAEYGVIEREEFDVGSISNSRIFAFQEELPDEVMSQRYTFINSGSYIDMAKAYQAYLIKNAEGYLVMNNDTAAPCVIEVVGAVDKVKQILGMPVSRPLELTTYKEAANVATQLDSEGIDNMIVKMTGWCNGGVEQQYLKDVDTIWSLGSGSDLKNLCATVTSQGNQIYLDGITEYAYNSNIFDGFFAYRDSSRFISRELCKLYPFSQITYGDRDDLDEHYLLHEQLILKMMRNLVKVNDKYGATGASFQDIGTDLASDFYRKDPYSRQQALIDQSNVLKEIKDNGGFIMINSGNIYAAVYSDVITHMDLKGSEYTIIDEFIPFYELALHGYINYTGMPVNICGSETDEILASAEYGAGLCYSIMDEDPETLQKTLYPQYYGSSYAAVHDRLVETYTRYNNELGHTFNQEMTGHDNLSEYVSVTEYADGTKVYVNYGYTDYSYNGITVPARDYKVVK
ncbi:MAG: hypothetical protein J6I66_08685 [Lachnospiraceae bacterium]|nr:hypothetical protein [Lachnospiraceae bacterium]